MEIQLLLTHQLQHSSSITQLLRQLQKNRQLCMKIKNSQQQCNRQTNEYNQYISLYKEQWINKGIGICFQQLAQHTDLPQKQKKRQECVEFYMKGYPLFQENVREKLQSIIYKLDLSQL